MDEIQKSEFLIAKVLMTLMEWGIKDGVLTLEELKLDDEFRAHFFQCINWLVDEGVIRVSLLERHADGAVFVNDPVLTSYGMHVLGTGFSLGNYDGTLADAIKNVQSGKRSFAQAGDFLGGLLGGFTKSLGS